MPLLALGGAKTARLWAYVRVDRPWNGSAPLDYPVQVLAGSSDDPPEHASRGWQGILQADAYSGDNALYLADRSPGPVRSTLCLSHARRKFFELANIAGNVCKKKRAHNISLVVLEQ